MSDDERRAIFYKLEHDKPISLSGTGLKPIVEPSPRVTLAIPRENNLDDLAKKVSDFGGKPLRDGQPPNAFLGHVTDIREAEPTDRLSDGLLKEYRRLVRKAHVTCELEIISLKAGKNQQRGEIAEALHNMEAAFGSGVHGTIFEHEEIKGTCRVVIRCTGSMFQKLVEDNEWQTRISWFEQKPQFETFQTIWRNFNVRDLAPPVAPDQHAPVVCIVDSGVTPGNPFLTPVTRTDLIRSFLQQKPDNPTDEVGHGSGVASLASYYALNLDRGASNSGKVWVASARILDDTNELEEERLFSQVLREVVDVFQPLGIRIFNLSVANPNLGWGHDNRRTVPRKSWVARTIDHLSRSKDVVFVTCTGNLRFSEVRAFLDGGKPYPTYLYEQDARILDPGQAALALTVGSIAPNTLVVSSGGSTIAERNQPSPFTRSGPGIRGEIKPELVEFGGNSIVDSLGNQVRGNIGTNVVMASNKLTPALGHDNGTSFAAPRVSHKLALVLRELTQAGLNSVSSSLLKAFLVNSATYRGEGEEFDEFKNSSPTSDSKAFMNVVGYGFPDHLRATSCDDYTAILYFQGEINDNEVLFFDIPVPAELAGATGKKRLTVTVASMPEVQRWGLERYFGTAIKWRLFRGDRSRDKIVAAMSAEIRSEEEADQDQREEEDVELPDEIRCGIGIQRRSRGAIQHDYYSWTSHRREFSNTPYTLAVAAFKKWSGSPTPLGIVVRLEDLGQTVPIFAKVKNALSQIQVRTRARR